jgi:5-methylcytosine-specific restriction enzyme subunit McrC
MNIPVKNLFFLLSYGWDVNWDLEWSAISGDQSGDPLNLLTRILVSSTDRLIRRGVDRGYVAYSGEILGVRGRIDLSTTIKRNGFASSKLTCMFDDLNHSVIHNQIIKSTLQTIAKVEGLDRNLREEVLDLNRRLQNVESIRLSQGVFSQVRFHSNISRYRLPIAVAKLIYEQLLPSQESGSYQFVNISDEKLYAIFEKFVFKFYEKHLDQTIFTGIKRDMLSWQDTYFEEGVDDFLPMMKSDVSLFNSFSKLIIECKFYKSAFQSRKIDGNTLSETFIASHVYQLFAYLKNLEIKDRRPTSGLIIYPENGKKIASTYSMHGHKVSIMTVDLNLTPAEISDAMMVCLLPFRVSIAATREANMDSIVVEN